MAEDDLHDQYAQSAESAHEDCDANLDLLVGAEAISLFMFNDRGGTRRVYHAYEAHGLPAFKVGNALWARKSAIVEWVKALEKERSEEGAERTR